MYNGVDFRFRYENLTATLGSVIANKLDIMILFCNKNVRYHLPAILLGG